MAIYPDRQFAQLDGHNRKAEQLTLIPRYLFQLNWADSGSGFSWPEAYHYTFVPGFEQCVLTASRDSTDGYGFADHAIGWFPASTPWKEGCRDTITGWWNSMLEWDQSPWAYILSTGLITEPEADRWKRW